MLAFSNQQAFGPKTQFKLIEAPKIAKAPRELSIKLSKMQSLYFMICTVPVFMSQCIGKSNYTACIPFMDQSSATGPTETFKVLMESGLTQMFLARRHELVALHNEKPLKVNIKGISEPVTKVTYLNWSKDFLINNKFKLSKEDLNKQFNNDNSGEIEASPVTFKNMPFHLLVDLPTNEKLIF